jgi:hypothetical protein
MTSRLTALASLLVLPLAACDAQSDGKYNGDPLVTLTGTVENRAATAPAGVDLVVAYLDVPATIFEGNCLFQAREALEAGQTPDLDCRFQDLAPERVEVTGQFPAAFQFTLTQTPPANVTLPGTNGGRVAAAVILAVKAGSAADGKLVLGDLVGYSDYSLAYTDRAVQADNICRQAADGTKSCGPERLEAGFHVAKGLCGGQTVGPDEICSVLADDEPITVQLTDLETIVQKSITFRTSS